MESLDTRTIVNDFALVIDESYSMNPHAGKVVSVVDGLVSHLAQTSQEMNQETRISVYAFNSRGTDRNLVYNTDVLRIPSIAGKYHPGGNTALIDCTCRAIDELKLIPTINGEHSFVVFSVTDGEENHSRDRNRLKGLIAGLPDEWTVMAYVPDERGRGYAEHFGWHPGNIQIWDTAASFENVGASLRDTADRFMAGRSQGVRGYRSGGLFSFQHVSVGDIERTLTPLTKGSYTIETNTTPLGISINDFVTMTAKRDYHAGVAFYEYGEKTVKVQARKQIFVQTQGGRGPVYGGQAARKLLGLPNYEVTVSKDSFQDYSIFVQSTSHNRKILPGQRVLVLR
jgi:hypothetical protein